MRLQVTPITNEFRGEVITVKAEALVCPKCGYQTLPAKGSGVYGRLLVEAWREKRGLLTGDEIRRRREKLGLSQQKFAEFLRVGVASVKRWEGSLIQDEAMDELIRLKTDPEYAKRNYERVCRDTGVEAAQPAPIVVRYEPQPVFKFIQVHSAVREMPAIPRGGRISGAPEPERPWLNN